MIRTYSELAELNTFEQRYKYLRLGDRCGKETFGFDRYLNQVFYKSKEWRRIRDVVICRDMGCDLGMADYPCGPFPIVHHMNPIRKEQILAGDLSLLDPEYLVLCSFDTHELIHFGADDISLKTIAERKPNDQCPWKT